MMNCNTSALSVHLYLELLSIFTPPLKNGVRCRLALTALQCLLARSRGDPCAACLYAYKINVKMASLALMLLTSLLGVLLPLALLNYVEALAPAPRSLDTRAPKVSTINVGYLRELAARSHMRRMPDAHRPLWWKDRKVQKPILVQR
jgi:hypothetical protein